MTPTLIRSAIIVAIIVQILWAFAPRHGHLPRSPETIAAIEARATNPSEATDSALFAQIHRDVKRNTRNGFILLVTLFLADIAAIYFFWNHRLKPTPVSPCLITTSKGHRQHE